MIVLTVAAALLAWPGPRPASARPARSARRAPEDPARRAFVLAVGVVATGLLLRPQVWWIWVVVAVGVGMTVHRLHRPGSGRDAVASHRRQLAVRCDLIAACLRSGMHPASALRAVATVSRPDQSFVDSALHPGPGGSTGGAEAVLDGMADLLALGADPQRVWRQAAEHPDLAPIAAATARSAVGGTHLIEAFTEQAERLRRQGSEASARAAGRAGVLMVAPLAICFLPAFLCLGLAPVVIGLVGDLGFG